MKTFNVTRAALELLPVILRKPVVSAIFRCALSGLQTKLDEIEVEHNGTPRGTYYRLRHTGQVCSLESRLNDTYDATRRRIVVNDGNDHERWWLYSEADVAEQPAIRYYLPADGRVIYPDSDYLAADSIAFVVNVPSSLTSREAAIRQTIDDTRIAGVSYLFNWK